MISQALFRKCGFAYVFFFYFIQPQPPSVVGRFTFVLWMVFLGGLDLVASRPEVAPAKTVVSSREVVVAFTFLVHVMLVWLAPIG
jgi:hypothetical protein